MPNAAYNIIFYVYKCILLLCVIIIITIRRLCLLTTTVFGLMKSSGARARPPRAIIKVYRSPRPAGSRTLFDYVSVPRASRPNVTAGIYLTGGRGGDFFFFGRGGLPRVIIVWAAR